MTTTSVALLLLTVLLYGSTRSACTNVVQPWRAAQAVMDKLPADVQLRRVDPHSLHVLCAKHLTLGIEVDGELYEVAVGDDGDWNTQSGHEVKGVEGWSGVAEDVDMWVDNDCVLPEVTLTGPVEVKWPKESRLRLFAPPEASPHTGIERLILKDGVCIKVDGIKALHLREPVALKGIQSEKFEDSIWRTGESLTRGDSFGVRQMHGLVDRSPVRLEAVSVQEGFSVRQLPKTPVTAAETFPGTLSLYPAATGQHDTLPQVEQASWLWPFLDTSSLTRASYDVLLQRVLQKHRQEFLSTSTAANLILRSATSQAVTLLHLLVEVQITHGFTELIEAHVLINEDGYTAVDTQLLKSHRTITMSPYNTPVSSVPRSPEIPLYDIYV